MTEIRFLVPDALQSSARAAGLSPAGMDIEACHLHTGDVFTLGTGAAALAFRVAARWYRPAAGDEPGVWYLRVESCPHPLDAPELGPPKG